MELKIAQIPETLCVDALYGVAESFPLAWWPLCSRRAINVGKENGQQGGGFLERDLVCPFCVVLFGRFLLIFGVQGSRNYVFAPTI